MKPLLYVYRVLLTGIHLMRTGELEANLVTLNQDFRLPCIPELWRESWRVRRNPNCRTPILPSTNLSINGCDASCRRRTMPALCRSCQVTKRGVR